MSVRRDEAALPALPPPGHALRLVGSVPRPAPIRPGTDRPRLRRRADLLSLDLLEEQRDRAIEDGGRIAVRDLAAQERLKSSQLVVRVLADRELDAIALRRGGRPAPRTPRAPCRRAPRCGRGDRDPRDPDARANMFVFMRLVYHGDFRCSGLARHRGQDEASRTARRHGAVARGKRTPSHQRCLTRITEMKASRSEPRTRKGGSESERIRKNSWQSHDATAIDPVSKGLVEQGVT